MVVARITSANRRSGIDLSRASFRSAIASESQRSLPIAVSVTPGQTALALRKGQRKDSERSVKGCLLQPMADLKCAQTEGQRPSVWARRGQDRGARRGQDRPYVMPAKFDGHQPRELVQRSLGCACRTHALALVTAMLSWSATALLHTVRDCIAWVLS